MFSRWNLGALVALILTRGDGAGLPVIGAGWSGYLGADFSRRGPGLPGGTFPEPVNLGLDLVGIKPAIILIFCLTET